MPFESGGSRAMRLHLHPAIRVSVLESPCHRSVMPHFRGPRSSWRRNGIVCLLEYQARSVSVYKANRASLPLLPNRQGALPMHSFHPAALPRPPFSTYRGAYFPMSMPAAFCAHFSLLSCTIWGRYSPPTALKPNFITVEMTSSGENR